MSVYGIRLTIVALLAGFYYVVCLAFGASPIVTIFVVLYAVLAGILTMTLTAAAGSDEPDVTRSPRGERRGIQEAERARSERAAQPSTGGHRGRKRKVA